MKGDDKGGGREGAEMYELVRKLFPICRSITGNGVRETLRIVGEHIPIKVHEVPTGTRVFDWTVPKEWNITDAYVISPGGEKIIDFKKNNLHVVGYSVPVDRELTLSELKEHLHTLPDQPDAIPYVTSYFKENWGFCLTHQQFTGLEEGTYRAVIESTLTVGSLTYGELVVPGASQEEVFISTYVCHPSMANNELSGPAVATFLARWLMSTKRRYTYRFVFIPETIGSLTYVSKNLRHLKQRVITGFNLSCVGDERDYSYVPTRYGNTYTDKVVRHLFSELAARGLHVTEYSYLDRGSDERQYNSPGVDLPVVSISRSKYGTYPEYHTSLDNLELVTAKGLGGSLALMRNVLEAIENNHRYQSVCRGEPQLGRRGLYPTVSKKGSAVSAKRLIDFLAYADGTNDLIDISQRIHVPLEELYPIAERLREEQLIVAED